MLETSLGGGCSAKKYVIKNQVEILDLKFKTRWADSTVKRSCIDKRLNELEDRQKLPSPNEKEKRLK